METFPVVIHALLLHHDSRIVSTRTGAVQALDRHIPRGVAGLGDTR
jgi:hypothetical protein